VLFVVNGWVHPRQHVTLTVDATQFIGAVDRWILTFTWNYDDPASDDEEQRLIADVRIMILGPDPIGPDPVTFSFSEGVFGSPLEFSTGTYFSWGMAQEETLVSGVSGYITISRQGGQFVGGVHLELAPPEGVGVSVIGEGPFAVPVP
jgi:hypothetical protein